MAKGNRQKDKQYNGQMKSTKGQTVYWPKEIDKWTNNIKAKGNRKKDKQYNGQRKTSKDKQYNGQKKKTTKGQII